MSTLPPTTIAGARRLAEQQPPDAAFDPCFDLVGEDVE